MKNSKKFLTRVLTGALAVSMLASTGICASAAEAADDTDVITVAEEDVSAAQSRISGLLSGLPKEIVKKVIAEFRERGSQPPKPTVIQKIRNFVQEFKARSSRFIYSNGGLYFKDSYFLFQVHISLADGVTADVVSYYGQGYEEEVFTIDVPAYALDIPVTKVSMFAEMSDEATERIKTLKLPATIKYLDGQDIFDLCMLENIDIDPDNPYFKSVDGVAFSKDGSKLVAFPSGKAAYSIPLDTTAIGDYAFYGSAIQGVVLPLGITSIGEYAFADCMALESIFMQYGLEYIGEGAFMDCVNLRSAAVPCTVRKIAGNAFDGVSEDFCIVADGYDTYASKYAERHGFLCKYPLTIDLEKVFEEPIDDINMRMGTSVTFTASTKGGSEEGYQYAFYCRNEEDSKWSCKQKYGENNVFVFTPAKLGIYEICVKVKDSEGTVTKFYTNVLVNEAFRNYSKLSAYTIKKGESVTVTGIPEEGKENCTYAFYYKRADGEKWTKKQGFDTNSVVTITPDYATDYVVCIKIKDENGFVSKIYYDLKVTE